jgi:hypothetical protein
MAAPEHFVFSRDDRDASMKGQGSPKAASAKPTYDL